jgi:hypothetical protein
VSYHRGDLAVSHEFLGYFRGNGSVALVVPRNHLEWMAVYPASPIDLFGRQLHALKIL